MPIKVLMLRHRTAPLPSGCRWCGAPYREHATHWVPSVKWHVYADPTPDQVYARIRARFGRNKSFVTYANEKRTTR
jgi:hypothetical protein